MKPLVILAGAAITVATAAIAALRAHKLASRYAPAVAARIPSGVLVLVGAAAGIVVVVGWLVQ